MNWHPLGAHTCTRVLLVAVPAVGPSGTPRAGCPHAPVRLHAQRTHTTTALLVCSDDAELAAQTHNVASWGENAPYQFSPIVSAYKVLEGRCATARPPPPARPLSRNNPHNAGMRIPLVGIDDDATNTCRFVPISPLLKYQFLTAPVR